MIRLRQGRNQGRQGELQVGAEKVNLPNFKIKIPLRREIVNGKRGQDKARSMEQWRIDRIVNIGAGPMFHVYEVNRKW